MSAIKWALTQEVPDPTAKLVLVVLADAQNAKTGRCDPGQKRIAEAVGVSLRTVERHVATLRSLGLVETEQKWKDSGALAGLTYVLALPTPMTGEPVTRVGTPPTPMTAPPVTRVGSIQRNEPEVEPEVEPLRAAPTNAHRRDLVWDELEAIFGAVPPKTNAHGKRNKACGDLKRFAATPETIRRAHQQWASVYPGATCTDTALATHYAQLLRPQSEEEAAAWARKAELEALNARYEGSQDGA